jgi:polyisoprenoid-binding protein YceI
MLFFNKQFITCFSLTILSISGFSQVYSPVDAESNVSFVIKNFGIKVDGIFKGIKGKIQLDPASLPSSSFSVSVDANTVNTDNSARDKHLKKADYFHVEQFPLISFVSTKITQSSTAGSLNVVGNLTLKGITKEVAFNFTATPVNKGYRLKGSFTLNRLDFKVGGNSLSLSDNLTVSLDVLALSQ